MLILSISIYVVLGLVIGTLIITQENPRLYKQLKNEDTSYYNNCTYANGDIVMYILIYYILWPFPFIRFTWLKFWKYMYIGFQKTIQGLSELGDIITHYFKYKFIEDIKDIKEKIK